MTLSQCKANDSQLYSKSSSASSSDGGGGMTHSGSSSSNKAHSPKQSSSSLLLLHSSLLKTYMPFRAHFLTSTTQTPNKANSAPTTMIP
eukprot:CAMPEP_0196827884 /NCGR_PEP_ID=MMETSP1362-20130617/94389_1 /TAXON_ID=163516 /ORGANISM="Leptocylindrus danicus, Strain CCMP1856" /LENGTH=88 /DNA_ID=CAMNT_0042208537 /DNA_START=75 /DNA_END=341 /DNA_ORIENTATION=-